ncbi:hypothetical protein ACFOW1_01450 [Parasediminibacterium paludis]|uniref:Uncharacterized protein n=1 Tax=Parasediminibacterium paludis TaxID=908966 RepID=A0ABV8PR37_9BACT
MLENYYFDTDKQRFKPLDRICSYCGNATVNNEDESFYFKIFKEKSRLDLIVYRNVKYSEINLGIPRCTSCKDLHKKIERQSILTLIAFHLFCIGYILVSISYINRMPLGLIVFSCIIYLIYFLIISYSSFSSSNSDLLKLIQIVLSLKYKILSPYEALDKNEFIKKLLENGWKVESPNP